ncbi:hypothetical protein T12_3701 [Trichinella patagoniensis]|uniref:Uncharacterized protein n=1 Tax=Trichinella patagoniensis TaxID=990121 RepID=A0A0V0ZGH0_9BILA|nr:hypothetical protein T12_3701 [Trichinella patagoniensis]
MSMTGGPKNLLRPEMTATHTHTAVLFCFQYLSGVGNECGNVAGSFMKPINHSRSISFGRLSQI